MLNFLRRIVQEVNGAPTLAEALSIVVTRVCEYIHVEACSIYLWDKEHQQYLLISSKGYKPGVDGKLTVKPDVGLIGLVGSREEPINLEDAPSHPNYAYFKDTGEEIYRAFIGVPLIHQRHVIGILVAQQRDMRKFDESEEAFMVTVSAQLAGIIAQAKATRGFKGIQRDMGNRKEKEIQGIPGAPGVGIGTALRVFPPADLEAVPDKIIDDIPNEIELFNQALSLARDEIKLLASRLQETLPEEDRALFDAYLKMLDNDSLGAEVIQEIKQGQWAQGALRNVIAQHISYFEAMDDVYLRERAADIRDLGRRVLMYLQADARATPVYPDSTILIGDEVSAANLVEIPREQLKGVISVKGSSNSHVAILARSMGVPTVMGADTLTLTEADGEEIIVDGYHGRVYIMPSAPLREEFTRLMQEETELYAGLERLQHEEAITPDGHRMPLLVNAGLEADIPSSLDVGAEGVGLYRTEVPFLIRDRFPTEEEQRQIYRQMLQAFAPRPVTMRTLDVGGDKMLPYFNFEEDNPFLGWRGVRITLDHPELFLVQIRAMLRASSGLNNLRIMLPMISSLSEVREAKELIYQAYDEVHDEDSQIDMPQIGVMVEVPSAVYQAEKLASECDFLSVGSNDLTQYILALDRNNSRVAKMYDSLHPAVLHALIDIVSGAHAQGKPASVCGEMAGDPASAILLLAMGYNTLSMNAMSLTRIKWVIRNFHLMNAQDLLARSLECDSAKDIRKLLESALETAGLGGLVRAGK
jgi:phosphotransferase system enzyme I (PtsP)